MNTCSSQFFGKAELIFWIATRRCLYFYFQMGKYQVRDLSHYTGEDASQHSSMCE